VGTVPVWNYDPATLQSSVTGIPRQNVDRIVRGSQFQTGIVGHATDV